MFASSKTYGVIFVLLAVMMMASLALALTSATAYASEAASSLRQSPQPDEPHCPQYVCQSWHIGPCYTCDTYYRSEDRWCRWEDPCYGEYGLWQQEVSCYHDPYCIQ